MNRHKRTIQVNLGVAHIIVAIILLPTVFFLGFFSIPTIVPGLIWLVILGFLLCRGHRAVRPALRLTNLALAPLATLLVVYGTFCLHAARRSAESGGGLLGTFGLIPIVMGVVAGGLSVVSLCVAHSDALMNRSATEQPPAGNHLKAPHEE
jgi:hypothetical protein